MEEFQNILLFFSDEIYEKLKQNQVWSIDGTFDVVPTPYNQLFTIGYKKDHHILPCVFPVYKDKTQNTYTNIFRILHALKGAGLPNVIKSDFEKASINAILENFPFAHVSGCLFHLGQNIQRYLQNSGMIRA